jgi:F-type H+-transporting ATPase subunit a
MASLAPEVIFDLFGFHVTNTILATLLVDFILLFIVWKLYKKISMRPKGLQSVIEPVVMYFYELTEGIAGEKRAKSIFPWVVTFFLFIVTSNLLGLLPGIGSIGIHDTHGDGHGLITLIRPATSDFNATLALATISLFATHFLAIKFTGFKDYISRFVSLNPILLFVGVLELVSEFIKLFSLSFRLFGNIYAGEVVLATISGLFAFLAPLPFLMLESIVAIVQGLVFALLTMVFMSVLTTPHHEGGEH